MTDTEREVNQLPIVVYNDFELNDCNHQTESQTQTDQTKSEVVTAQGLSHHISTTNWPTLAG